MQPVGVLMVALSHFLADADDPMKTVAAFRAVMAPGSALVLSHATPGAPEQAEAMRQAIAIYEELAVPIVPRDPGVVAGFFEGLDVVSPGLVGVDAWRIPGEREWQPRTGRVSLGGGKAAQKAGGYGVAGVGILTSGDSGTAVPTAALPVVPGAGGYAGG